MEHVNLPRDLTVFYVEAGSFPEGVAEAHNKLRQLLPSENGRSFYGISYPDRDGAVIYKAATPETFEGEADRYDCGTFLIKKGTFLSKMVSDWPDNVQKVKDTFDALLSDPRLDTTDGYCLEEYIGETDMRCMVPLQGVPDEQLIREKLSNEIEKTFDAFRQGLADFDHEALNTVPFEESWTAGQVAEHIIKSVGTLPDSNTKEAGRFYDEKVYPIKKLFLNFSIKMESPGFVLPEQAEYDKNELLKTLQGILQTHLETIKHSDLSALCVDFEFPGFGHLTRHEWMSFFLYHTQRHHRQLINIYQSMSR